MLASMVHNRIAIAMATINGNSTDRVMEMRTVMHGAVIAVVAITKQNKTKTNNQLVQCSCDLFFSITFSKLSLISFNFQKLKIKFGTEVSVLFNQIIGVREKQKPKQKEMRKHGEGTHGD